MTPYTLTAHVHRTFPATVAMVRESLADQGFGIITEIDLKATLKAKLDVDVAPQVILGACRPQLAYQALQLDPSIAAVLPCNVVVRSLDEHTTIVEAFDPDAMVGLAGDAFHEVAADARRRLGAALGALTTDPVRA